MEHDALGHPRPPRWRADVSPDRAVLIAAMAVVAAAMTLFTMIAEDILDGGGLISRDDATLAWFIDHRTDALISASRTISTLGSFTSLSVFGIALGLWLWRRGVHPLLAASPVASLCLAGIASTIAKALFDRPRPPAEVRAAHVTLAAFPSGHATDAAGLLVAVGAVVALAIVTRPRMQVLTLVVGGAAAGAVGISRLVLGVHWLSDVVAGWALGTAVAVAAVTTSWWFTTRPPMASAGAAASPEVG